MADLNSTIVRGNLRVTDDTQVNGSISEGGTLLSDKYLGKTAKASDSDKLDGQDSTYYLNYNNLTNKPTIPTDTNQKIKAGNVTFGNNDVVDIVAGSNTTVTGLASGTGAPKITISATDTGATSIETTGSGNVVNSASYDSSTRKITLSKGVTALTSHQSIKTLKTDNTTAQSTSSSEAIAGSGTINLHKVAKTGTYSDLIGKPTIPATNVIPATTTANKVLVSTTTSGTAKWSDWSSAGFLKTNASGVISVDTNTYLLTTGTAVNAKELVIRATKGSEEATAVGYYKFATITQNTWNYCSFTMLVSNSYAGTMFNTLFDCRCSCNSTTLHSFAFNIIGGTDISDKLAYLTTKSGNNITKIELFIRCTRYEHPSFYLIANKATTDGSGTFLALFPSTWGATPDMADNTTMTGNAVNTIVASNALKLNGQEASYYLNYNNLSNKPTIPSVSNATITVKQTGIGDQTFTLNGSAKTITLVDTNTWRPIGTSATDAAAGNHAHGNITNTGTITSTAVTSATGFLVYDSNNKIQRATSANARTILGAGTYSKPSGGIPASDLAETYYLASNPNNYTSVTESTVSGWGFTKNAGTVTSVRVQAGTGLNSSTSTAQTSTLNTTISIASGYKLPTTTEWNAKANDSAVVHLTGDEQINGNKTFIQSITINGSTDYAIYGSRSIALGSGSSSPSVALTFPSTTGTLALTSQLPSASYSSGLQISTGRSLYVPYATADQYGVVKPAAVRSSAITTTTGGTTSNRYYGVEKDSNGKLFVNVPWSSNVGTVTSVGAGTGLSISGTASVNPTVNIASGYKLPTTTEWENLTNSSGVPMAQCSTSASTAAKVATLSGYVLTADSPILLYVASSNTNTSTTLTLNVNSTGAKNITINGYEVTTTYNALLAGYYVATYNRTNSKWNLTPISVNASSVSSISSSGNIVTAYRNYKKIITIYGTESSQYGTINIREGSSSGTILGQATGEQGYWAKQDLSVTAVVNQGVVPYAYLNKISTLYYRMWIVC